MEEVNKFLGRVRTDFMQLKFVEGRKFAFRPPRTIILGRFDDETGADEDEKRAGKGRARTNKKCERYKIAMLHEIGHALLEHKNYTTDPERLRMESDAWGKAKELCAQYNILYDEEFAEGELDSYREWLHRRSRCPECGLTRYQTKDRKYHCPSCGA